MFFIARKKNFKKLMFCFLVEFCLVSIRPIHIKITLYMNLLKTPLTHSWWRSLSYRYQIYFHELFIANTHTDVGVLKRYIWTTLSEYKLLISRKEPIQLWGSFSAMVMPFILWRAKCKHKKKNNSHGFKMNM